MLQRVGSRAHRLSYSESAGIFRDQGLNLCPLYWQTDSYPLCHQGSTNIIVAQEESNYQEKVISSVTIFPFSHTQNDHSQYLKL